MQIFLNQRLAMLAVPKTGTTSRETAMRKFVSIDVRKPPRAKHVSANRWNRNWKPFLSRMYDTELETVAVLREPLSRIESWFRYRKDERREHRTGHLDFEGFVELILQDRPPPEARIGSQDAFVSNGAGEIIVDHLFALERPEVLQGFLRERFGEEISFKRLNVSQPCDATLSSDLESRLRTARAREFELYARVAETGYLDTRAIAL